MQWSNGSEQRHATFRYAGLITATVSNQHCTATEQLTLNTDNCDACDVNVPNAFTPNGDGRNEQFLAVPNCELDAFELQIYDRWGQQVFTSNNARQGWDGYSNGNLAPAGAYLWKLHYRGEHDQRLAIAEKNGVVFLVR